jgi:alpha-mannosidase
MPVPEIARRIARLNLRVNELRAWRNAAVAPIESWTLITADGARHAMRPGDRWPVKALPVCFEGRGVIPAAWAGQPVDLELWLGGEGWIRLSTGLEAGLNPYHHRYAITAAATGGEAVAIDAEVSPKGLFGGDVRAPQIDRAHLVIPHATVQALAMELDMAVDAALHLGDHEIVPRLLDAVDAAIVALAADWPSDTDTALARYLLGYANPLGNGAASAGGRSENESADVDGFYADMGALWSMPDPPRDLEPLPAAALAAVDRARAIHADAIDRLRALYPPVGHALLTGHAHIDLGWLWPVHETRRKVRRTTASQLDLLDRYPAFHFNQSSAQVYAWLAEDAPHLYARVREHIAAGRWEPVGGMWVEPDCQVTGGEAMVRQIVQGQRLFRREFGQTHRAAWLPDVFGFSGGMPQILRLGGLTHFFTTKLNWNESNRFPYDLFHWEGIDGTRVVAWQARNLWSNRGYNSDVHPEDLLGAWRNWDGKRWHDEMIVAFGWGDGGGGPTERQVRQAAILEQFPALPRLRMGRVDDYAAALPTTGIPVWMGEMNLELHRGTLTSQARTKKLNRAAERRMVEAEIAATLANALTGRAYPQADVDHCWQVVLLNQFHDILPGSSIREVYAVTEPELETVVASATGQRDAALATLAGRGDGLLVANTTLAARPLVALAPATTGPLALSGIAAVRQPVADGVLVATPAAVPPVGWTTLAPAATDGAIAAPATASATATGATLANDLLRVEIGADGTLAAVTDLRHGRQVLTDRGNQLRAYVDKPRAWDAWDVDETYPAEGVEVAGDVTVEVVEAGPIRAAVRVARRWRSSTITQTYRLTTGSARIDIVTAIDWHERRVLLRARFPLAVHAHESVAETMYGVHRRPTHVNTTWQQAQFEQAMHRFVDLSETGYGVAVLNDGKYACSTTANEIGISLLRSPIYPDALADEGAHAFTYSLFPHAGGWAEGGVVDEAIALDSPLVTIPGADPIAGAFSFVASEGVPVTLGALHPALDGNGVILRVHASTGARGEARLRFHRPLAAATRVDLLEDPLSEAAAPRLSADGTVVALDVRPFELVTLRLVFA